MNRIISILITTEIALLPLSIKAQQELEIGYCGNDIAADIVPYGDSSTEKSYSAAICLPGTKMMRYAGGKVTKIRIGLRSGFTSCSVWLRTELKESSIIIQSVKPLQNGWNEVELKTPYDIDGTDLYVGYTVKQPAGFTGILGTGNNGNANSAHIYEDGAWNDMHSLLGALYIQAIVEAETYLHDLAACTINTNASYYKEGNTMTLTGTIENTGDEVQNGYKLVYLIDDKEVASTSSNTTLITEQVANFSQQLTISNLAEGQHKASVVVKPLNGNDQNIKNDTISTVFYTYESSFARKMLLEHYTSLACVQCPAGDKIIHEAIKDRNDVVWVSHHVGYRNDEFVLPEEELYVNFGIYGNPEIVIDRAVNPAAEVMAIVPNGYNSSTVNIFFNAAQTIPSFVQLDATAVQDGNNMEITVNGMGKNFFTSLYPRTLLTVFVVEDNVYTATSQYGDPDKHYHDNITRAILTRNTGDAPTWDNNSFTWTASTPIAESWNAESLRVVALLTDIAPAGTSYPTGSVLNATEGKLQTTNGISAVTNDRDLNAEADVYDMSGRKVGSNGINSQLAPGLYIIQGQKVIIKQ